MENGLRKLGALTTAAFAALGADHALARNRNGAETDPGRLAREAITCVLTAQPGSNVLAVEQQDIEEAQFHNRQVVIVIDGKRFTVDTSTPRSKKDCLQIHVRPEGTTSKKDLTIFQDGLGDVNGERGFVPLDGKVDTIFLKNRIQRGPPPQEYQHEYETTLQTIIKACRNNIPTNKKARPVIRSNPGR